MHYLLLEFLLLATYSKNVLTIRLITKLDHLDVVTYKNDIDVTVTNFKIPHNIRHASFKLNAYEEGNSILGCRPRDMQIYFRMEGLSLPNATKDATSKVFNFMELPTNKFFTIQTNNISFYINISLPTPGHYYLSAYLSNSSPGKNPIRQKGLPFNCRAYFDTCVFVEDDVPSPIIANDTNIIITSHVTCDKKYRIFVPENVLYMEFSLHFINQSVLDSIELSYHRDKIPEWISSPRKILLNSTDQSILFDTIPNSWHYFSIQFDITVTTTINFSIQFCPIITNAFNEIQYYKDNWTDLISFKEILLYRITDLEPYLVQFDYPNEPHLINISSMAFISLQFFLEHSTDIGGTLEATVLNESKFVFLRKNSTWVTSSKYRLIGCLALERQLIPTYPNLCRTENGSLLEAPVFINSTSEKSSIHLYYPESGLWFATIGLFCDDECTPCTSNSTVINGCPKLDRSHDNDDCIGNCRHHKCYTNITINFNVQPCANGSCNRRGKCRYGNVDDTLYSVCDCYNNYKGWDCSDSSDAIPLWKIRLELSLLIISNIFFIPAILIAFSRRYYSESIVYCGICVFSILYHACDAGHNVISFCIVRWSALQFADFYGAFFGVWVTLVAIANVNVIWTNILHVCGAIMLPFFITIDKTALWVIIVPVSIGVIIIAISWSLKYYKHKQLLVKRIYFTRYVSLGVILVIIGFIIFTTLETEQNYKYLHSLWHCTIAVSIILLLPKSDTFQMKPPASESNLTS